LAAIRGFMGRQGKQMNYWMLVKMCSKCYNLLACFRICWLHII